MLTPAPWTWSPSSPTRPRRTPPWPSTTRTSTRPRADTRSSWPARARRPASRSPSPTWAAPVPPTKINVTRQLSGDTRLGELSVTQAGQGSFIMYDSLYTDPGQQPGAGVHYRVERGHRVAAPLPPRGLVRGQRRRPPDNLSQFGRQRVSNLFGLPRLLLCPFVSFVDKLRTAYQTAPGSIPIHVDTPLYPYATLFDMNEPMYVQGHSCRAVAS